MGLDQSFYSKRPPVNEKGYSDLDAAEEVLYFRKYHELQSFISDLTSGAGNGVIERLQPDDLKKVVGFIVEDKNWRFWKDVDDEAETFEPSDEFFRVIGLFTYYSEKGKELYYMGDW